MEHVDHNSILIQYLNFVLNTVEMVKSLFLNVMMEIMMIMMVVVLVAELNQVMFAEEDHLTIKIVVLFINLQK